MNDLAVWYNDLGRHVEALKLDEETLALRKKSLGLTTPTRYGACWRRRAI